MKFRFVKLVVEQADFVAFKQGENPQNVALALNSETHVESDNQFGVHFSLALTQKSKSKKGKLTLRAIGLFTSDEPLPNDFPNTPWAKVNAPAIAFPFVRAFVGTFMLNAGHDPIILPAVNFQALYEKELDQAKPA